MARQVWQTDDGKIFQSSEQATIYENSIKEMSFRQWASNGRYVVAGAKAIIFKDGIAMFGYHQTKERSIGYYDNSYRDNAAQEIIDREYDEYTARKAKEDADRANGPFAYSDSDYEDRSHIWP